MPYLVERLNEACLSWLFLGRRDEAYAPLIDLLGVRPGESVLDAGCGPGWLSRRLGRRVSEGGSVLGVDPSAIAVAYARTLAGPAERHEVGSLERVPAADSTFDRAVTSLVLHHVAPDEQPRALGELRRVLRPGGTLLVVELVRPTSVWAWAAFGWQGCVRASLPEERLRALASEAGFVGVETGVHWSWLRWLRAVAPEA